MLLTLVVAVCPSYSIGAGKMPWGHKCVLENVDPSRLLPPNAQYLCHRQTPSILIRKSSLQRLPALFELYPHLHTLDVSYNKIYHIDTSIFFNANSLKVLKLSGNNFTAVQNYTFTGASFLVRLDLKRCGISELNANSFVGLSQLRILDLSENRIKTLPRGVFIYIHNIAVLNLGSNLIEVIDDRILERLHSLKSLILSKNRLNEIHQLAFLNAHLTMLDLDHNPTLNHLYLVDASMRNIATLKVNNCSLEVLIVPYNAMAIEAAHNNINYILPAESGVIFKMRRLNLDHNKLVSFENFTHFSKLEMLDVNDNLLTTLNTTQLKAMDQLALMQVARNPLVGEIDVSGITKALPMLQELTISKSDYNDAYLSEVRRNLSLHKIQLIIDEEEGISPAIFDPVGRTETEFDIPSMPMHRTPADLRSMVIKMRHNYDVHWQYISKLEHNITLLNDEWKSIETTSDQIYNRIVTVAIWMYSVVCLGAIGIAWRIFLNENVFRNWFDGRIGDESANADDVQPLHSYWPPVAGPSSGRRSDFDLHSKDSESSEDGVEEEDIL